MSVLLSFISAVIKLTYASDDMSTSIVDNDHDVRQIEEEVDELYPSPVMTEIDELTQSEYELRCNLRWIFIYSRATPFHFISGELSRSPRRPSTRYISLVTSVYMTCLKLTRIKF